MHIDQLHEPATSQLLSIIPPEQLARVFDQDMCDIDAEFLGFVGIYQRLADIIPEHWTVIDLGCAYAPQAFFFTGHEKYVGVDLGESKQRFVASNSEHYVMSIETFCLSHAGEYDQATTFAICSYVPSWGGDNMKLVRQHFKNLFTYYPAGDKLPILLGQRRVDGQGAPHKEGEA